MTSFCEFMISQMNISRKDEYLTNFTIINKEIKHKVHKIVVSSASSYFRSIFDNECSETIENKLQMNFHSETFNDVINYMYSGIINMTDSNIEHVIEISRYFLIEILIEQSNAYLLEALQKNPSSSLISLLYKYEMPIKVNTLITNCMANHDLLFEETLEKYVFLRLSFDELKLKLVNREFTINDGYDIVRSLTIWCQHDIIERLAVSADLFELININKCSKEMAMNYKNVDTNNSVLDKIVQNINLKILLYDSIKCNNDLLNMKSIYGIDYLENIKLTVKILYNVNNKGIYNVKYNETLCSYEFGNVDKVIYTSSKQLYIFNFIDGKLFRYDQIDKTIVVCSYPDGYIFNKRWPPTVNETSDGNLIIIGGEFKNSDSDKVKIYNTSIDSWSEGLSLPAPLVNHATVVYNEDVYVISGHTNRETTQVLVYKHSKWVYVTPLSKGRQQHFAVLYNECIYAFTDCEDTIKPECYDIKNEKWSTLETTLYDGINNNCIYDAYNCIIYSKDKDNIYCVDMENKTNKLLYCNCENLDKLLVLDY